MVRWEGGPSEVSLPGPSMFRTMELLRGKAAKGEAEPRQPQQYYLDLVRSDPDLAEAMRAHGQELG